MTTAAKLKIADILDKIILACLFLYTLTFLLDIKINFLTTAFAIGLIKLFFVRPKITISSKLFYLIAIFLVCTFLSILFSNALPISAENFSAYKSRFISPLIGILILFLFKFTYKRVLIILSGFSISLLLNALFVIYQASIGEVGRLIGFSSNYMLLCSINLLILPIIFTLAIHKSKIPWKLRSLFIITTIVNMPAIMLENTRIVWLGILMTFVLIILLSLKNKLHALLLILVLAIGGYTFLQLSPYSMDRFASISDTTAKTQSNYQRILMWNTSIKMVSDHPVFGIGVGNYHEEQGSDYLTEEFIDVPYHPHNTFLYMFAEAGILGGISCILIFLYLYYRVIFDWIKSKDIVSLAYLSCLIAYTINNLTDSMFCGYNIKTATYIFWLFTAFYLVLNNHVSCYYKKD